jgi:proteasome lid subunit RPN8/RPN11
MSGIPSTFTLGSEVLETLFAYQQAVGRQEVCGLCAVDATGRQHFLALRNYAADPNRFETSVADEAVVRSAAAHRAWRISAFVHTHRGGAPDMSGQDAVSFRRDTLPWVIVAINGGKVQQRTYTFLPDSPQLLATVRS